MTSTPVWLTRSLLLIAVGASLALGVTWHNATFDIQTAGEVLACVGGLDLVLNLWLWFSLRRPAPPADPYAGYGEGRYADAGAGSPTLRLPEDRRRH